MKVKVFIEILPGKTVTQLLSGAKLSAIHTGDREGQSAPTASPNHTHC